MPFSTYLATEEECVVDRLSLKTPATAVKNTREGRGSRISSCRVVSSATSPMLLPQSGRKQRRCWSPELHHRFVKALEELGGSQGRRLKLYILHCICMLYGHSESSLQTDLSLESHNHVKS
ncbi:hypothetical protein V8G54_013695 [Vigna mungo]|uniref:Uncharacterized protein n=1 Tax=Vigna mungo TaxID=3915 RepID=A0AAQ3NF91_VIGMU